MSRAIMAVCLAFFSFSLSLQAQFPAHSSAASAAVTWVDSEPDPSGGGGAMGGAAGGGGQVQYTATRGDAFSRLGFGATVSTLGIGAEVGTNAGPRMDIRMFGNYTNLTDRFTRSGFRIAVDIAMANTGAKLDFYPLRRIPLRISPGFLYFNHNRVTAELHAEKGASFTLNNVNYLSSNTDPVHGTGGLLLGGTGFMATAGLGHIVSHNYKRFSFPFEAGVVFINKPVARFNLTGTVCSDTNAAEFCQPAAQFPTFSDNLRAQVISWNHTVAPYHIYPIIQGGFAYTFSMRRRGVE